jgi:hypothetical protein
VTWPRCSLWASSMPSARTWPLSCSLGCRQQVRSGESAQPPRGPGVAGPVGAGRVGRRRRLLGHTWVTLTRTGLRLCGLEFEVWTPALDRLDHHHAAAVVRLHRETVPGADGWVCERALWRRRGKAAWHLADAALPAPAPAGWAEQGISEAWELVEVELTQKARPVS